MSLGKLQSRKATRSSSAIRHYLLNRKINEDQVSTTPEDCPIPRAPAVKVITESESMVWKSRDVNVMGPVTEQLLRIDVWKECRNNQVSECAPEGVEKREPFCTVGANVS